jgi:hypothetical protein
VRTLAAGPGLAPAPNTYFIVLDLTLENTGSKSIMITSYVQMSMQDDTGRQYVPHSHASVAGGATATIDGALDIGDVRRGIIGYQIPIAAQGLRWTYVDQLNTGRVVFILDLRPAPVPEPGASSSTAPAAAHAPVGTTPAPEPSSMPPQTATLQELRVTINTATITTQTGRFEPRQGHMFVVLDVTIENLGREAVIVSALRYMTLQDDRARSYTIDVTAAMDAGQRPEGKIPGGEKIRGMVGYEVPLDAQGLQWTLKAAVGTQRVTFPLNPPRPADLPTVGTSAAPPEQPPLKVGDQATLGHLRIIVSEVKTFRGRETYQPEPGNRFVSVAVTVENTSGRTVELYSLTQMFIVDEAGQRYSQDTAATLALQPLRPLEAAVASGAKQSGVMGYQVPMQAKGLQRLFEDQDGTERSSVAINPK